MLTAFSRELFLQKILTTDVRQGPIHAFFKTDQSQKKKKENF